MTDVKTAVVTGASSGVGREVSILLSQADYQLVLAGRREQQLRDTAELCQNECLIVPTDLCDPQAVRDLVDTATQAFGRLDALANIAGFAPMAPIEQTTEQSWRQVVDANLSYVVHLTAAAWPMLIQHGGVIVNVSSMASIDPFPGLHLYAVAKAGLNMFTLAAAREGEPHGVRTVALAPGAIETPMLRALFDETMIPKDRTLSPTLVAQHIVDLITGRCAFQSGEVIQLPNP